IDEDIDDQRDQYDDIRDVQECQRRQEEKHPRKRFRGVDAVERDEIQLRRRVMKAVQVPEQLRVIETVHPVTDKMRAQKIDQERESDFKEIVSGERDPR